MDGDDELEGLLSEGVSIWSEGVEELDRERG